MQGISLCFFLALFVSAGALAAKDSPSPLLVWKSGGVTLDGPSQKDIYPKFLYPYHSKSLEWTEEAFCSKDVEVVRGISYGKEDRQKLDVWTPRGIDNVAHNSTEDGKKKLLPIVVIVHGGGWEYGYREYNGFIAPNLCFHYHTRDPQAIMITPSYKLGYARDQMWPESKNDILQVIAWLKEEKDKIALEYGGDCTRIILSGHSAGAHLSGCVGLCTKTSIKGLFLISGPLGLRPKDWVPESSGIRSWLHNKKIKLFGFSKSRKQQIDMLLRPIIGIESSTKQKKLWIEEASPLANIEKINKKERSRLPFVHYSYASKGDFPMLPFQAKKLKRLLGDNAEILALPVDEHLESHFCLKEKDCQWYDALSNFLDSI